MTDALRQYARPPAFEQVCSLVGSAGLSDPGDRRMWRGGIDLDNLGVACRTLGIELPLLIERKNGKYRHAFWSPEDWGDGEPFHCIKIQSKTDVSYASQWLWHELGHAAQGEFMVRSGACGTIEDACEVMNKAERRFGYHDSPFERACRWLQYRTEGFLLTDAGPRTEVSPW